MRRLALHCREGDHQECCDTLTRSPATVRFRLVAAGEPLMISTIAARSLVVLGLAVRARRNARRADAAPTRSETEGDRRRGAIRLDNAMRPDRRCRRGRRAVRSPRHSRRHDDRRHRRAAAGTDRHRHRGQSHHRGEERRISRTWRFESRAAAGEGHARRSTAPACT